MEGEEAAGLVNSVARFIHLVACQTARNAPTVKYLKNAVAAVKLLKPVLDWAIASQAGFNKELAGLFEELDALVNEAREIVEEHAQRTSKLCNVLQCEPLAIKAQQSSMEICRILSKSLQSVPPTALHASIQRCMQELEGAKRGNTAELIELSLRDLRDYGVSSPDGMIKIAESLGLTSNERLLAERIALEKEKARIELSPACRGDAALVGQLMQLVRAIGPCLEKQALQSAAGDPSPPVPPYFRCPLSSELMLDPVILASGQTFERCFIRRWLDSGLGFCPTTRQPLAHTNLVPNYTVKALIANWCEENGVRSRHSADAGTAPSPSSCFLTSEPRYPGSAPAESASRPCARRGDAEEESSLESRCRILPTEGAFLRHPFLGRSQPSGHSPSESASSATSTLEAASRSAAAWRAAEPSSPNDPSFSPWSQGCSGNGYDDGRDARTSPSSTPGSRRSDDLADYSLVERLVDNLRSGDDDDEQGRAAAAAAAALELRLLAKHNAENRVLIARCGAIPPLVALLGVGGPSSTQENAVTALLNLSIDDGNKTAVVEAGAVEPLVRVLRCGSAVAKENAAATLSSLAAVEEYKLRIGRSAGAVKGLVDLLGWGTLRGKKDAATALFSLSIVHENKARIVQAGAVGHLVEMLDPDGGMVDKAVALLANLSTIGEGRSAIAQAGGIPLLVEVVEAGSEKGKENAASALMQLCMGGHKMCGLVLQEGAVPPLIALSQLGTPRAREKAQQILSQFRCQREGGGFGRRRP